MLHYRLEDFFIKFIFALLWTIFSLDKKKFYALFIFVVYNMIFLAAFNQRCIF